MTNIMGGNEFNSKLLLNSQYFLLFTWSQMGAGTLSLINNGHIWHKLIKKYWLYILEIKSFKFTINALKNNSSAFAIATFFLLFLNSFNPF